MGVLGDLLNEKRVMPAKRHAQSAFWAALTQFALPSGSAGGRIWTSAQNTRCGAYWSEGHSPINE